ncbi:hypothetical protein BGX26_011530 [Mortierella sp. AD094]|nr:hypothetical protein BGX26_011530 [Mortierella sp. AD094]
MYTNFSRSPTPSESTDYDEALLMEQFAEGLAAIGRHGHKAIHTFAMECCSFFKIKEGKAMLESAGGDLSVKFTLLKFALSRCLKHLWSSMTFGAFDLTA